jgi:transposase-like protein
MSGTTRRVTTGDDQPIHTTVTHHAGRRQGYTHDWTPADPEASRAFWRAVQRGTEPVLMDRHGHTHQASNPGDPRPKRKDSAPKGTSPATRAEAIEQYKAGATQRELADQYKVSTTTIRNWLRQAGIDHQPKRIDVDEARRLYQQGLSHRQIADLLGHDWSAVGKALRRAGHKSRSLKEAQAARKATT